jgi:taurine transport system substrate-binding protein
MKINRRTALLSLIGFGFPLIISSCSGNKPEAANTPSANPDGVTATSSESSTAVPAKIRIGYQVIPNAELLAKAKGLVKKAFPNSVIEYKSFDSGRDVNTAFAANGIDIGVAGSVPTSVGISKGLPYKVFFINDVIGKAEALIAKNNISSIKDLKGKKIATPFGSTAHFSLLNVLKLENIKPSEVTILDLQPPDIVAAWKRGDIDAAYVWQPNLTRLIDDGGKILITSADLAEKGVVTADLGLVSKEFLKQYPDAVKKYVDVLNQATEEYRKDPNAAAQALANELKISPEDSKVASSEIIWLTSTEQKDPKYLGTQGTPGNLAKILKESADFLVTQKTIPSSPNLEVFQENIYTGGL